MNEKLDDFHRIQLDFQEKSKKIIGIERKFPLYTTQLINIANQNAQGTRPKVVGQMSELIKKCPNKTYEGWKNWYLEKHPKAINNADDGLTEDYCHYDNSGPGGGILATTGTTKLPCLSKTGLIFLKRPGSRLKNLISG